MTPAERGHRLQPSQMSSISVSQSPQQSSVLIDHFNSYRRSLLLILVIAILVILMDAVVLFPSNALLLMKPLLFLIFCIPSILAIRAVAIKDPGLLLPLQFFLSAFLVLFTLLLALTAANIVLYVSDYLLGSVPDGLGGWDYLLSHLPLLPAFMKWIGINAAWKTTLFIGTFSLIAILVLVLTIIHLDSSYGQLRFTSDQMHQKALRRIWPFS